MTMKEFRLRQGLTQAEMAHKAGLSRMTINRLETNGRMPSITVMRKIGRAFNISSSNIFDIFYGDMTFKEGGLDEQRTEATEAEGRSDN